MANQTDEKLMQLVKEKLEDPDVQNGLRDASLSDQDVLTYIIQNKESIWNSVITESQEFDLTLDWLRSFRDRYPHLYQLEMEPRKKLKRQDKPALILLLILVCARVFISPFFFLQSF